MNKAILARIFFILLCPVFAEMQKVMVLDLYYDNGKIFVIDKAIKYGYYPEQRHSAESEYSLQILQKGSILHSSLFKEPNIVYREGSDENGILSGGKVVLDEREFSVIVPYFGEADEIRIISPEGSISGSERLEKGKGNYYFIAGIMILAIVIIFVIIRRKSR